MAGPHRVETASRLCFIVRQASGGWSVRFKGREGLDRDLEHAACLALDGGSHRDVSTVEEALGHRGPV